MSDNQPIIVKIRKINDSINGNHVVVTDEFKKHKLTFPINDINYNSFVNLLGKRVYAYFYAQKQGDKLQITVEAPFQGW